MVLPKFQSHHVTVTHLLRLRPIFSSWCATWNSTTSQPLSPLSPQRCKGILVSLRFPSFPLMTQTRILTIAFAIAVAYCHNFYCLTHYMALYKVRSRPNFNTERRIYGTISSQPGVFQQVRRKLHGSNQTASLLPGQGFRQKIQRCC